MTTSFPTSLQDLDATRGQNNDKLSSPNHVTHHNTEDDTIEALQAKVGINGSADTTSHDYKLSGVTGSDKATSLTGTEVLTNKTLSTGSKILVGSDATGDIYYNGGSGVITRKAIGATGKILKVVAGLPSWEDETVTSNASTTVKGVVEAATQSEVTAGTATGGTGAVLVVTPDSLAGSTPVFNGSGLTNVVFTSSGTTTKNAADASTTQTFAHGFGKAPKGFYINFSGYFLNVTVSGGNKDIPLFAEAFYNGTTQSSKSRYMVSNNYAEGAVFTLNTANASDTQNGTITWDATNVTITWTKTGSPTGTYTGIWHAITY